MAGLPRCTTRIGNGIISKAHPSNRTLRPWSNRPVSLTLQADPVPLRLDEQGGIRVGETRILLELVIDAYREGADSGNHRTAGSTACTSPTCTPSSVTT